MLTICKADPADLEEIWALVRAAIAQMNALGNPQWGEDYPSPDHFAEGLAAGELYAAREADGSILGVAILNTWQEDCYGELTGWREEPPALVIHKMAVAPAAQRRGVASALFAHAFALAREQGLKSVRMDTYTLNHRMRALVDKLGFRQVGAVRFPGRPLDFPVYEKVL